jgi:hypothetical protein
MSVQPRFCREDINMNPLEMVPAFAATVFLIYPAPQLLFLQV